MINTRSATETNPYMESLQQVFEDSPDALEWLVIAHQDPRMVQALTPALSSESAAILEASQETWDEERQALDEAIAWALREGQIKNLVFVGHSHGGGPISRSSLTATAAGGIPDDKAVARRRILHALASVATTVIFRAFLSVFALTPCLLSTLSRRNSL